MIFKQLPTMISDLNKLGIALKSLDVMKIGTVGVNAANIEAYRIALKGLSVEQSVFALASKGATEEQIRQILVTNQATASEVEAAMAKAGLTTATKALTQAEMVEIATKNGVAKAEAEALLSKIGVTATEEGQVVVKKQVTLAMLEQAVASGTLTKAEASQIATMLGLNAVETANIGITNVLTASFTKLWAVITAHPIGAILTAIGAVAVGTIAYINKVNKDAEKAIVEAHENAKQALEDTKTSLSDDKSELQSVNSELETTKERLKEISSIGAPTLTEQNELTKLSTANAQLETRQKLLENNIKLKQKAAALDAKELLDTQVEMEHSDILDNSSIVSKKESYTYAEHAEYQASKLRNAYNIYMNALKNGDVKRQQLAQELISASGGNSADFTSALLEIVESFKYDDGTIIDGYEDIYNEYMGMIYNLQSLTNPDTFLDIAKSITVGTGVDYEKAISEAYALAYEGNFDVDNLNQDFVEALADAGIDESTISYIFKLKQQEYQLLVDKINSKYDSSKLQYTYWDGQGKIHHDYEKENSVKADVEKVNQKLNKYARENPIEFQLVSSYDENFTLLDKYIEKEKKKATNSADYVGDYVENAIQHIYDEAKVKSETFNNKTDILSFLDAFNSKDFKESKEKLLDLATSGELSEETLSSTEEYKKLLTETGLSASELVDEITKLNIELKENDVESLTNALEKVKSGASFSAEEISVLVSKNEKLAGAIKLTENGYTLEEEAVVSLINSNIELYNTSVANEIERTKSKIEATESNIAAIEQEIAANEKLMRQQDILTGKAFKFNPTDNKYLIPGSMIVDENVVKQTAENINLDKEKSNLDELKEKLKGLFKESFKEEIDKGSGSSKSKTDNIFDWIEIRISRLQSKFQNMVDSVTKYVSRNFKLDSIDNQIAVLDEQISTYEKAAQAYLDKANSISLPSDLKYKVMNGLISIEEIDDEDTRNAVNQFKEWYEKYLDSVEQKAKAELSKRDKLREALDIKTLAYENTREYLGTQADKRQDRIDFKEAIGGTTNKKDYRWLIDNAGKQYDTLQSENTLLKDYLTTLDDTSEEWTEIRKKIEDNNSSMRDLISSQTEWNNKIAQMPMDKAEKAIEKISSKEEYINAKYDNPSTSVSTKRKLNTTLAGLKEDTLEQYRNAYKETNTNFNYAKTGINRMNGNNDLVSKVQKYTKTGKEIPSNVLSAVYNSGNTALISRCEEYNASYLAKSVAYDTYQLNREQTRKDLSEIGQKNLELVTLSYKNKNTPIENKKALINAKQEQRQSAGKYESEKYYRQLIDSTSEQIKNMIAEKKKLDQTIKDNLNKGLWTKNSQEYKYAIAMVQELDTSIVEMTTDQINYNNTLEQLPIEKLERELDLLDKISSKLSSDNELKKKQGKDLKIADYTKELNVIQDKERNAMSKRNKYMQLYAKSVMKGNTADADKYLKLIYEQDDVINQCRIDYIDFKKEMRDDIGWRTFERAHKAAEQLKTTISSLIDLIDDDTLFDDNGNMTFAGTAKMALLVKEYEASRKNVKNFTSDIKHLNKMYEEGQYTEEEYKDKLAELNENLLGAAKDAKSARDALIDMVISQKEVELDAMNELIDKRKEALNAKKEYYDYDKTIKDKTNDIKSLQAQIAALEGVDNAEAKAQLARKKSELQKAQDDLEETKFDHKIEVILEGFDGLKNNLQENFDEYSKNLKSSYDTQIEIIRNANTIIGESYDKIVKTLTKTLWNEGVDADTVDVKPLAGFTDGVIINRNSDSALNTILSNRFADMIPDTSNIMSRLSNFTIPNMSNLVTKNDAPVVNLNYENLLNINGNVIDMEKATMDVVKNNMKTIAKGVTSDLSAQWRKLGHK